MSSSSFVLILFTLLSGSVLAHSIYNAWQIDNSMSNNIVYESESNYSLSITGEKSRGDYWHYTLYEDMPDHLLTDRTFSAIIIGVGMFMLVAAFIVFVVLDMQAKNNEKKEAAEHDKEMGVEFFE
ncbi:MAG: exported protein of unknown function [Candidatus Thorarchaeota archaeon]|nr:MAG: exported protein of unknown function [Candidatus Thorarchaeota archaeon]